VKLFSRKTFADPPDPRKQSSGTSITAKGSVPTPGDVLNEDGSQAGGQVRDVVPQLSNKRSAIGIYEQMAAGDVSVDVSLRAAKTPVSAATYFVEAFDDKEENQEIASFVQYNLLQGTSAPFLLVLEDILRMYEHGFSVLEKVFEIREWVPNRAGANRRKYTMLKKLAARPALTIKEIQYDDNGGPVAVVHNAVRADKKTEEVTIPIEKAIIFTWNKKGGNLEGRSLLRTSYKHWYYKEHLYKIDAIQKERHGIGVPDIQLAPGYTDNDKKAAHELGRNLRTNERAYIVRPPGLEVGFAKVEGQLVDIQKSIDHHNGQIMLNVMVQFLLMGLQEGGGRATAGSHQNMFEKSLRYVANLICEYINLYLIPQLVAYNFDTDKFPRLRARNIGEVKELQQWASGLANLASQNLITLDFETENWVREIADMPAKLGGKQTPENNSIGWHGKLGGKPDGANKGGVQTDGESDQSGNIGKLPDEPSL
jgi:hypothetical protein